MQSLKATKDPIGLLSSSILEGVLLSQPVDLSARSTTAKQTSSQSDHGLSPVSLLEPPYAQAAHTSLPSEQFGLSHF